MQMQIINQNTNIVLLLEHKDTNKKTTNKYFIKRVAETKLSVRKRKAEGCALLIVFENKLLFKRILYKQVTDIRSL